MIPKSIIITTISILKFDLCEFIKIDKISDNRIKNGYEQSKYTKIVKNNIEIYNLLIKEYEKYLEENYQ
jgi:hypothetical protein